MEAEWLPADDVAACHIFQPEVT